MIRAFGSINYLINQFKPSTIVNYFFILRFYQVNYRIDIAVFDNFYLLRLIQGTRSLFFNKRRKRLFITRNILSKIILTFIFKDDYNINAVFKLAFVDFLRIKEFIYIRTKKNTQSFTATGLTRSDLILSSDYTIVKLKKSKTDKIY